MINIDWAQINWGTVASWLGAVAAWAAAILLYFELRRQKRKSYVEAQEEWDHLAEKSRVFWKRLAEAYQAARVKNTKLPANIEELIDSADFIQGLPVPEGKLLLDLASTLNTKLKGADNLLWEFACSVYPAKQAGKDLSEVSLLEKAAFDEFHLPARGELARFWNRWGAKVFKYKLVSFEGISEQFFPDSYRMVKLLSYLETAQIGRAHV